MHDCDVIGNIVSLVQIAEISAPFCLNEVGVYSTVNVVKYADISFTGQTEYDLTLIT